MAQDDASKQGAATELAQAQCNPVSILGMGYSSPPRSTPHRQPSISQTFSSTTNTPTEASPNSTSPPIGISNLQAPKRSLLYPPHQARQTHQSRPQTSRPRTPVRSRHATSVPVSPKSPSAVPRSPSRNSYTETVGLARSGRRSYEQKLGMKALSPVGKRKKDGRARGMNMNMVVEDPETYEKWEQECKKK